MIHVVFEAGSRCGLSAKLFFLDYIKKHTECEDELLLLDMSKEFVASVDSECNERIGSMLDDENARESLSLFKGAAIFPADELSRQRGFSLGECWYNEVKPWFYDKSLINDLLDNKGIRVPVTFNVNKVIVKPNSLSAGSKGIEIHDNACVSEMIDVAHEYVVDILWQGDNIATYPREVVLKNGYDQYVKFVGKNHRVNDYAKSIARALPEIFRGVSHVQVIESKSGILYYVEGSKRLSGTSMVNILFDANPFDVINGEAPNYKKSDCIEYDTWYRYDYLYMKVCDKVYE